MKPRVILLATPILLLLYLGACAVQIRPPARSFRIEQLLIDDSWFPPGWTMEAEGPSAPRCAPLGGCDSIERIELTFYATNSVATEEIHRFRSEQEAAKEFEQWLGTEFYVREIDTPWAIPPELPYQSHIAIRSHFACAQVGGTPMCRFLGQYDEYLVRFNTHMAPRLMLHTDLERILRAIDQRMAQYLGIDE